MCCVSLTAQQQSISVREARVLVKTSSGEIFTNYEVITQQPGTVLVVADKWCVYTNYNTIAYFDSKEEAEKLMAEIVEKLKADGETVMNV